MTQLDAYYSLTVMHIYIYVTIAFQRFTLRRRGKGVSDRSGSKPGWSTLQSWSVEHRNAGPVHRAESGRVLTAGPHTERGFSEDSGNGVMHISFT